MPEQTLVIKNSLGLHARPAAMFVEVASRYDSQVMIEREGMEVNGKSIMGVLMLAAEQGARLQVRAEGPDAKQALEALADLVENRMFDEK
jgi:phosphocarrier protein HPr